MSAKKVICFCTPLNTERIGGILRYAREHGWSIILSGTEDERYLGWGADGVLATLRDSPSGERLHRVFASRRTPLVDLSVERPDLALPRVACDHEAIGRIAAQHLREHGFGNFAWFSTGWTNVHALRFRGLCADGAAARWIVRKARGRRKPTDGWKSFLDWIGPLLASACKPLGVLAYDETDASRILSACHELGIAIPEQVAVIACGNESLFCDYQPVTISGIDANLALQGYEAARLLDRLMAQGTKHRLRSNSRQACAQGTDCAAIAVRPTHNAQRTILIPPRGIVLRQSTDVYTSSDPTVQSAFRFIEENLSRPLGAAEIAKALELPRHRLDRLFAATMNVSVGHEIARLRLAKAKRLVEETDLSVAEIARSCGYCNAGYLVTLFRKAYKLPPGAYRKDR